MGGRARRAETSFLARCSWAKLESHSQMLAPRGNDMEKLIDIFCHAIRITDPLSIKIAVGVIGGGLPLFIVCVLLIRLGDIVASQREATMPSIPARQKRRPGRRSAAVEK